MKIEHIYENYEYEAEDNMRLFLFDYLTDYSLFENILDFILRTNLTRCSQTLFLLENVKLEKIWQSHKLGDNKKFVDIECKIDKILDVSKSNFRKLRDAIAHSNPSLIENNSVIKFSRYLKVKKKQISEVTYIDDFEISIENIHNMHQELVELLDNLKHRL